MRVLVAARYLCYSLFRDENNISKITTNSAQRKSHLLLCLPLSLPMGVFRGGRGPQSKFFLLRLSIA